MTSRGVLLFVWVEWLTDGFTCEDVESLVAEITGALVVVVPPASAWIESGVFLVMVFWMVGMATTWRSNLRSMVL